MRSRNPFSEVEQSEARHQRHTGPARECVAASNRRRSKSPRNRQCPDLCAVLLANRQRSVGSAGPAPVLSRWRRRTRRRSQQRNHRRAERERERGVRDVAKEQVPCLALDLGDEPSVQAGFTLRPTAPKVDERADGFRARWSPGPAPGRHHFAAARLSISSANSWTTLGRSPSPASRRRASIRARHSCAAAMLP